MLWMCHSLPASERACRVGPRWQLHALTHIGPLNRGPCRAAMWARGCYSHLVDSRRSILSAWVCRAG